MQLHYRRAGTGATVLLLHGFGETGDVFQPQIEFLSGKYQVLVPDLPGSGKSPLIADMSIEGMADAVYAFLTQEIISQLTGNRPIHLIGHSMGGYIALAFAEKHPEMLASFGLFHSSAYADSQEKIATRKKGIDFIRDHGAFAFLKNAAPNLFSPDTKASMPALIDEFVEGLGNFSAEALVYYYEAMMARPDRTEVLKTSKVPVLFILGEHDTAIPLEQGLSQTQMPEKSYIQVLSHSGHMGMIEQPTESNQELEKFLKLTDIPFPQ